MPDPVVKPAGEAAVNESQVVSLPTDSAKAERFFAYARRDGMPVEGALTYWIYGLREDPGNVSALKEFFQFCTARQSHLVPAKALDNELKSEARPAHPWCRALLASVLAPMDGKLATAAVELAVRFGLYADIEVTSERALNILALGKTGKSDTRACYLKLVDILRTQKLVELAERGAIALSGLYPQDGEIATLRRDVSAERYSVQQGLDQPIVEGTFRQNIRDPQRQRELEQDGRLSAPAADIDQRIDAARLKCEEQPLDAGAVLALSDLLIKRSLPGDEQLAHDLLATKAQELQSIPLRHKASDLRMRMLEREYKQLESEGAPAAERATQKRLELVALRQSEFELRVKEEPQNSRYRLELGRALLDGKDPARAVSQLQLALQSLEQTAAAGRALVQAFLELNLHPEAVRAFRSLAASKKVSDDAAAELSKRLLEILVTRAENAAHPARASAALAGLDLASEILSLKWRPDDILPLRRRLEAAL